MTDYVARPDDEGDVLLPRRSGRLVVDEDGNYSYSYGPKGLQGLLHNRYALGCAVFASIGGLTFGYDQGVIANVLVMKDFEKRFPIDAWQKGLMTAVLELGCLFGALAAGTLADRYSRRHSIFFACVVFCIGAAFQCGAVTFGNLVFGRAVGGLGVGALSMLSPLYMAEISPPELRGSLMALEQLAIVFGVVLGFWTGYFTRDVSGSLSWRIPLGIQLLPGLLLSIGCIFLPPSPRLLVSQGRIAEARRSLAKLRNMSDVDSDLLLRVELLEMQVEATLVEQSTGASPKKGLHAEVHAWARLFSKKYIDRTLVGVLMMFFQQWSGINALLYYGPTLIQSIGLRGDGVSLIVAGGVSIVQMIGVFPAIVYIDSLGRRPLLRGGSAVMASAHLVIALLVWQYQSDWAKHALAAWFAVGCVYLFTAAYSVSYGPIGWVLPSEVFPQSMRSRGVSLSTASNWLNNFIIGLITPGLMELSASGTFLLFSCACFAGYLWSTYRVPETANVPLEEIDSVFRTSAGLEEVERRRQIETDLGLHELLREAQARD
ncbi:MFS monosaccharide transporter [Punctularia strigosozonata HHB-11173 SS5]|uniref:MFS monosaccharide transporter n=1 Tax=Punctularia strigosozonata (strain HHB-11173) TaxID=741275 RepID=UPI000441755D|nr:MFS monosaccharide transporter [Punctularia strigosozonata HHB-11173 SS5]EIN06423.1 MFS monosaccharide transporter [Punctularia strigosozonata HHB-11173 SS5]